MTIEGWIRELELEAARPYIRRLEIIERSRSMIKARLIIGGDLFIQVYHNDRYNSTNLVLIYNGQRHYGRDQLGGAWHRHPVDLPQNHDRSPEGKRATNLHDFLNEVEAILAEHGLP